MSKRATSPYDSLLGEPALLEDENEDFYNELWDAVVAEVKPVTFLEWVAVKDYTDKLFEEYGYKAATTELIDGARRAALFVEEEKRELTAIERYLANVQKLDRMVANREAARRSLQKEFRRKAEKDVAAPSIVPESEKRVAKPEET